VRELQTLTEEQCEAMLREAHLGRVAISTPKGPHVTPVLYTVVELRDRPVAVMRTTPYSLLASQPARGSMTLEVDNLDESLANGWTVSARGRCEAVRDERERTLIEAGWTLPSPADSTRTLFVKLAWNELSGRIVGPDHAGP
jgi:nitroimidazol reductase NimA-like FMN-containing flavoprotein (pyridoxamine 5'-phosphate oxidase superfamily)